MVVLRLAPSEELLVDPAIDDDDLVLVLENGVALDAGAVAALEQAAALLDADAWFADIEIDHRVVRRPAWSATRILGDPTACSPLAVRARWLRAHDIGPGDSGLALRLAGSRATVAHIPVVLTRHRRTLDGPMPSEINAHLRGLGVPATVSPRGDHFCLVADPDFAPRVSVIVPTAGATVEIDGRVEVVVDRLLASLGSLPDRIEVIAIVGDEYRGDPTQIGIHCDARVTVIRRRPGPFNFSAAVNLGVLHAHHDLVLMLNDDIEADGPGFIDLMALHLADPAVAAVGARLLYPNGTVQHTGMIIDDARPLHPFVGWDPADTTIHGGDVARDVVAVTGGCLMVRRADFLAVGGLSVGFPLSFNDVDLCVRLRRSVGRVVIEPAAMLLHHETLTRAPTTSAHEWDRWISRWGEIVDPWYHPGHLRPDEPHRLHRNADHLDPGPSLATTDTTARTDALVSRVHRGRSARRAG